MPDIFGVTGWKNSGKTTLVAALVREFKHRSWTVNTVKHASDWFQIDREGTDSHAHRTAGAHEVAIVSDTKWALIAETRKGGETMSLQGMISRLGSCDIVLVEGYKSEPHPKIECVGDSSETPLWRTNKSIVAVANDSDDEDCPLPQFRRDDVAGIADYIAQMTGLGLT